MITFEMEDAKSIRVLDKAVEPTLIAKIVYNPALGTLELDTLYGSYLFTAQDLYSIANYMSKIDINNPKL